MRQGRESVATVLLAVTALAIAGCSDDDYGTDPQPCTPGAAQVCMTAATFNPATITITAGTAVQWLNTSGLTHTVTSDAGSAETFDHNVPSGSGGFSHQFNTPGTYQYYCTIHGSPTSGMRGTVIVN